MELDLCNKHECKVCSINNDKFLKNPKMNPTGSKNPLVYILGEAPGAGEDSLGKQFIGAAGKVLRSELNSIFGSDFVKNETRFNNCIRCRPYTKETIKKHGRLKETSKNRKPTTQEIECCRRSVEKDIEKSKPYIIIGTGSVPLNWVINKSIIMLYRGRKIPVKIGNHHCWYFPIIHPSFILRKKGDWENEYDKVFRQDLRKIRKFLRKPKVEAFVQTQGFNDHITIIKDDYKLLRRQLNKLAKLPIIALDIECSGLKPSTKDFKFISMAVGTDKEVCSFPIENDCWGSKENIDKVKKLVKRFLLKSGKKIVHNLKYELKVFNHYFGQEVLRETEWTDTMAMAYVLDERTSKKDSMLSLDSLCLLNLGFSLKSLSPNISTKNMLSMDLDDVLLYNGLDTKYTYELYEELESRLSKKLNNVVNHHIETAKTLALTEYGGVLIDRKSVKDISKDLEGKIEIVDKELHEFPEVIEFERIKGKKFKQSSPKDLIFILKNILKLKAIKYTKGTDAHPDGQFATDEKVLNEYAKKGIPLAQKIIDFRKLSKLKSTYVDSVDKLTNDDDNKLRADFNAMFTTTGRFSSDNPNMQNFPKRDNRYVRKQIIAPKGHTLVAIDYGQLEARVLAMVSGETNIIEKDVHMDWAIRTAKAYPKIAGVKHFDELDAKALKKLRSRIKNLLVFPWFYGAGIKLVSNYLEIPIDVVSKLNKDFWGYFSRVKDWQKNLKKFYDKYGYAETLTGRRRRAPLSINELLNSPVQGTASDIVVSSMNRLSKMSYDLDIPYYQAVLNIHDDLSFYIPDEKVDNEIKIISKEMVRDFDFMNDIPLEVEVLTGKNWYELEEYGTFTLDNLKDAA